MIKPRFWTFSIVTGYKKSKNVVLSSIIHHCQNPLELICGIDVIPLVVTPTLHFLGVLYTSA
jgi:hypothetical protein